MFQFDDICSYERILEGDRKIPCRETPSLEDSTCIRCNQIYCDTHLQSHTCNRAFTVTSDSPPMKKNVTIRTHLNAMGTDPLPAPERTTPTIYELILLEKKSSRSNEHGFGQFTTPWSPARYYGD